MDNAPAVEFPLGRSSFQARLIAGVVGISGVAVLLWFGPGGDARQWLAFGWWLLASGWMWVEWWRSPRGSLLWDGVSWSLLIGSRSLLVLPALVLDLQHIVLLRLQAVDKAGSTWVWLDRSRHPVRWLALRRAVYAFRRRVEAVPDLARGDR